MLIIERLKLNYKAIFKWSGSFWSFLAFFAGILGWEKLPNCLAFFGSSACYKILFLLLVGICVLTVSSVWICCCRTKNSIWSSGTGEIIICYDDIFRLASDTSHRHIVTIPVNDAFDTIIDDNPVLVENPLVSGTTVHGKWIKFMLDNGADLPFLDRKIKDGLFDNHSFNPISRAYKKRGKLQSYPIGTVSYVSGRKNVFFCLLTISKFDEHNMARSSPQDVQTAVMKLLDYYDQHGQGYDLYIPVMGIGLSRSGLSKRDAFQIIKATLLANQWRIKGKIHIVVYEKDKNDISIFD